MRRGVGALVVFVSMSCGPAPDEQFMTIGSREGERFVLGPDAMVHELRAIVCRDAPDEADTELSLAANLDSPGPVDVMVVVTTPDEERSASTTVEGPTRLDVAGLALPDVEASCDLGIGIRFVLADSATVDVGVEWGLHFTVHADEEIEGVLVEIIDGP